MVLKPALLIAVGLILGALTGCEIWYATQALCYPNGCADDLSNNGEPMSQP